jgi:hypothetical protein
MNSGHISFDNFKPTYVILKLYSTSFRRTTSVVRHWSNINDFCNFNSTIMKDLIADSLPFPGPFT